LARAQQGHGIAVALGIRVARFSLNPRAISSGLPAARARIFARTC
jgi:hypothetical protein